MVDDEDWRNIWTTIVPMYYKDYDPEVGQATDAATHYSGAAWNIAGPLLPTFNTLDNLANISVPTLALTGRHDFITPPSPGAERIQSLIPNSELAVFENSGHFPFSEEEDLFFEKVRGLARWA